MTQAAAESLVWFEKAARRGQLEAQLLLGIWHHSGHLDHAGGAMVRTPHVCAWEAVLMPP